MNEREIKLNLVREWVNQVVIEHQFCPFARDARDRTEYRTASMGELENAIQDSIEMLLSPPYEVDNVLLIITGGADCFEVFWNICEGLTANIETAELTKFVQIAHFHPHYCFSDSEPNDRGNWTNRSPVPVLHFLSTQAVQRAVEGHADAAAIPSRNIAYLQDLSAEQFADICSYRKGV